MTTRGVLLLSHCGFSFLEDLIAALNARGLRSYVLSSLPTAEHRPDRLIELKQKVAHLDSTESHELTSDDVDRTLQRLAAAGEQVLACISVWEGYRGLMANANAALGVPDLTVSQVHELRDKLALRNRLHDAQLSKVRAQRLTPQVLSRLQADAGRYFIKPISGIASYGAFPLRASTTWDSIQRISQEAQGDIVYRGIVGGAQEFLVEDYLAGREFSFELVVVQGHVHVAGIHEKCEVTETAGTVLEDSCTSPPCSIGLPAVAAGMAWVRTVFSHLGITWGGFHVEARFNGQRWDLIEINPRIGGSLISHSVKALNGGHGMLDLWLDLLVSHARAGGQADKQAYLDRLEQLSYTADGAAPTDAATFFRVYFGRPGKVERIQVRDTNPPPIVSHVLLKEGDEIANSAREVFLGQLLWKLPREERDTQLAALLRDSNDAIAVQYAEAVRL